MDAQKPREAPGKRLDSDEVNKIYMDVVLGRKPSITGEEAKALRANIEAEVKEIHAAGGSCHPVSELP